MLIYDQMERELCRLQESVKSQAAYLSDEQWNIILSRTLGELMKYEETLSPIETACMDITGQGGISNVQTLRKRYEEMLLLIIADTSISPVEYVKPSIMASSLLLRPCDGQEIDRVVREFMEAYMERLENRKGQSSFVIDTKEGKIHIPFGRIYYFEARDKKVFIQTDREEYGFYGTIDRTAEKLPAYFMRCHRSFIVNIRKIEKVMLSQNMIVLTEGRDVPLSRSYKAAVKELGRK